MGFGASGAREFRENPRFERVHADCGQADRVRGGPVCRGHAGKHRKWATWSPVKSTENFVRIRQEFLEISRLNEVGGEVRTSPPSSVSPRIPPLSNFIS